MEFQKGDSTVPFDLTDADVLIMAGDILMGAQGVGNISHPCDEFLDAVGKHYPNVLAIAGNHEFYQWDIGFGHELLHQLYAKHGIKYMNLGVEYIDDIKFIGTTLWTNFDDYNQMAMIEANQCMNDFRLIQENGAPFTAQKSYDSHMRMSEFVRDEIDESFDDMEVSNVVVITHHAPSNKSIHPMYYGQLLNHAFYSNLEHMVDRVGLWVHGHMHNSSDYYVGDGRVICNPRGYVGYAPNLEFNKSLVVEI